MGICMNAQASTVGLNVKVSCLPVSNHLAAHACQGLRKVD